MKPFPNLTQSFGTALLIALLCWAGAAGAKKSGEGYETPPVFAAADILPASLVRGPHHQVQDKVTTFESLHQFKVKTDWETMEVYGEPLLRVRLKEVQAIQQLKETSGAAVAGKAVVDTTTKSAKSLVKAVKHPIETAKALPGGIARMFKGIALDAREVVEIGRNVAEDYQEGGTKKVQESSLPTGATHLVGKYSGVNKEFREWAEAVGVDPYTTNPLLYEELRRVALIDTAASFGAGVAIPGGFLGAVAGPGGIAGLVADVSRTAYKKDWRELFEINRNAMTAMGADAKLIDRFERNAAMTPSVMTLIVKALERMEGVQDRHHVIQQASLLKTEAEALFFAECVMMAKWYHKDKTKLKKMLLETLIPVGLTVDGRVIAFSAVDYGFWDELNASLAAEFTDHYKKYSGRREAYIADKVSPKFVAGMQGLGWKVHSELRTKFLPEIPWGVQDSN